MNKLKKIVAGLLSLSMVFVMASCDNEEEASKSGNSNEAETTTVAEETTEPAETEETEEIEEEVEEEVEEEIEETTPSIDTSKLIYDFTGLDSESVVKDLTSGKYMIGLTMEEMGMSMEQTVYYDNGKARIDYSMMGMEYYALILEDKSYMVIDGYHCEMGQEELGLTEESDMFAGLGYYESGEIEYNGSTCKYDEYYQEPSDALLKFILDDSNELLAIETSGMFMTVTEYANDFDASLLELSADSEEVDQETLGMKMAEASGMGALLEGAEGLEVEEETVEESAE